MRRFLLAAGLLAAVTSTASAQTLRIALRQDLDVLDPTHSTTYVGRIVFAGMCDKLFDIDKDLHIVPQLATSYEWADSKTLVLHLRANVTFQDGEPFDADAVKFTLEHYLKTPGSYRRGEISEIDHIDVVDPLTVRIVLKHPSGAFLAQLTDRSGMMLPPKAVEQEGKDFGLHPVCSGPFKFVERVRAGPRHAGALPGLLGRQGIHFDKVIYQVLTDSSVRLANLKSGTIDLAEYIAPTDAAAVKADSKLRLVVSNSLGYFGITNNLANGPQANNPYGKSALVRQALGLAIDRNALVKVVFNDMYKAGVEPVPANSPFYDPDMQGAGTQCRQGEGAAEAGRREAAGQAGAAGLQQSGRPAGGRGDPVDGGGGRLRHPDPGDGIRVVAAGAAKQGQFQAYLIGWSGRPDIDGNTYAFLHSGQANNCGHYSNPTVDKLLEEGRDTVDLAKRKPIYAAMMRQELQGPADHLSLYHQQHRRDVGEAARVPCHPRRHDPAAGAGDGEVVRGHLGTRIAQIIPTLLLVSVLVFCLQQLMPGDPALIMAGEEGNDPHVLAQIRAELWLDKPLPEQYAHWMGNVLHGDLGYSWRTRQPVSQLIAQKLPVTLQLSTMAFIIAVVIGVPAGIVAAVDRNGFWDYVANGVGLAGLSTPNFWLGIMLILLVSVQLGWLPPSGYVPLTVDWKQSLATTIMPAFVLGNSIAAILMRHTRSAMLTALDQDFVRTARAKGLREWIVVLRHALRNALIPVVTLGALELGTLFSGAVLTEQVFSIPGFGKLIVDAVFNRDYPVVQGVVLVTAFLYVVLNLLADVLYVVINPRLRGA